MMEGVELECLQGNSRFCRGEVEDDVESKVDRILFKTGKVYFG